ncbi:hypothetical protein A3A45_00940 [Candidatus Daviesbacteria bacterium RIFCSPLOWO2_01_FULL_36_8]|nr:MAG: hypothetical protein A3A45_00940 [Candidatus Daviesbacteria bacterium RIFCSPLOWO2_01_FULL_36_8]
MATENLLNTAEFESLTKTSNLYLRGSYFHIGLGSVINTNDKLIPRNVLNGEPFDRSGYREDPDYYRVCTANGDIDNLAAFLVGLNARVRVNGNDLIKSARFYCDTFADEYAIAVFKSQKPSSRSLHDSGSGYLEFGQDGKMVPMQTFNHAIPISQRISIPRLSFTPGQTSLLDVEGVNFFKEHIEGHPHAFIWGEINRRDFSQVYLMFREQELAVKRVLLEYYFGQTKNR